MRPELHRQMVLISRSGELFQLNDNKNSPFNKIFNQKRNILIAVTAFRKVTAALCFHFKYFDLNESRPTFRSRLLRLSPLPLDGAHSHRTAAGIEHQPQPCLRVCDLEAGPPLLYLRWTVSPQRVSLRGCSAAADRIPGCCAQSGHGSSEHSWGPGRLHP